jgi:hypothetical protein
MALQTFSYKTAWFALRSDDTHGVARLLNLENLRPCEWNEGLTASFNWESGQVFLAPMVDGWQLCVGVQLFRYVDTSQVATTVARLSEALATEVQFFATHRVVEAHAWARSSAEKGLRTYSYNGSEGQTKENVGAPSEEELALGMRFFDEGSPEALSERYWERTDLRFPNEEDVLRLAGRWSLAPTSLQDRDIELSTGLLSAPALAPSPPKQTPNPKTKPWWRIW